MLDADSRFARCDALVDAWEGGAAYTDRPDDAGGPTRHGVTLATLTAWRKTPCTPADVQALTAAEASAIRHGLYWAKVQGDQLPAGLDLMVYDMAINMGPATAAKALQTVLGLTVDGVIGPVTLLGVHTFPDLAGLIEKLRVWRAMRYRGMTGFPVFGRGWLKRVEACAATARIWAARA